MTDTIKESVKRIVKDALSRLGYRIVAIDKPKQQSDKLVKAKIGDFTLFISEGHQLPVYLKYHKEYSRNLPRLAKALKGKYGDLRVIDVGANIGDTVALLKTAVEAPILCVEGDDAYFKILKTNTAQFKNVSLAKSFLSDRSGAMEANWHSDGETAQFKKAEKSGAKTIDASTLDHVVAEHGEFIKAKLIKVDTDGYDPKIIRGAKKLLGSSRPVLFFEHDPIFLRQANEDGLEFFEFLKANGYKDLIFYDNFGKIVVSTTTNDKLTIRQLHEYVNNPERTPFPYYDVAAFHEEDADVASRFIEEEMRHFYPISR